MLTGTAVNLDAGGNLITFNSTVDGKSSNNNSRKKFGIDYFTNFAGKYKTK